MFEHLDDPNPPPIDAGTRRAVSARRAERARRNRRLLYGSAASVAVAMIAAATAYGLSGGQQKALNIVTRPGPATTVTTPPPTTARPPSTVPVTTTLLPTTTTPVVTPPPLTVSCAELVPTGANGAVRAEARDGSFSAVLSGTLDNIAPGPVLATPRLEVISGARTLLDETVLPPKFSSPGSVFTDVIPWTIIPPPAGSAATQPQTSVPLCLARSAAAGSSLTVLLGFFAGGAHCCVAIRAIPVGPTAAQPPIDLDLGNAGAEVEAHDGRAVIVAADDRFAYAFASYAASGLPLLAYEVSNAGFVNMSVHYQDLITQDAAVWWKAFIDPQNAGNGLGVLAAWVADQCRLGRSAHAWATVDQLNAGGKLTEPPGATFWPQGSAYLTALHSFLQKYGYC